MRRSALWLVASLAVAASACVRTTTDEASGSVDVDIESPTKQGEDWSGELRGQGMYTSVTGSMKALVNEGRSAITVTLENATPGASYTWDVREGKCGQGGGVVGYASEYSTITVGNDGKAGTTVTINARLDEAKDYALTVYRSPSDVNDVIACGDLDD